MSEQIEKWNSKYRRGDGLHHFEPSSLLVRAAAILPPGLALDVASGGGRHAIYLAELGWRVVAVEGARAGIDVMVGEAERRGVADRIEAREADLEARPRAFRIEPEAYDIVCDFFFLDRTLFDELCAGVRPGGLFVAAIHFYGPAEDGSAELPKHRFMLEPGELEAAVAAWGWEILHAREGDSDEPGHHHPTAEIISRRRS